MIFWTNELQKRQPAHDLKVLTMKKVKSLMDVFTEKKLLIDVNKTVLFTNYILTDSVPLPPRSQIQSQLKKRSPLNISPILLWTSCHCFQEIMENIYWISTLNPTPPKNTGLVPGPSCLKSVINLSLIPYENGKRSVNSDPNRWANIWGAVKIYYNGLVCFWRVIVFWGGPYRFTGFCCFQHHPSCS